MNFLGVLYMHTCVYAYMCIKSDRKHIRVAFFNVWMCVCTSMSVYVFVFESWVACMCKGCVSVKQIGMCILVCVYVCIYAHICMHYCMYT